MKKNLLLTVAVLGSASFNVLAQTAAPAVSAPTEKRVINIQGAPRGDLRNGPLTFSASPVKATVSTLQITAQQAVLTAPKGTPIIEAKGKRLADFTGNIQVSRGRLSATGTKLAYSEVTGQGLLTGNSSATFLPDKNENGDPVSIKAAQMSLDVDNNVSTSTGAVQLVSGNQTGRADKLVFDEDRELAQLTGGANLTRAAKGNQKELVISGQEVRALTKNKTLYVKGGVKLVQGTQTTTGDAVYYDDKNNVAYVIGNAVSVDSKSKVTLRAPASGYLEQRTDFARVSVKNAKYNIPADQFKLRTDK